MSKNKEKAYHKKLVKEGIISEAGVVLDPNFRWPKKPEQEKANQEYSDQKLKEAGEREMERFTRRSMFDKGIDAIKRLIVKNKIKKKKQKKAQMQQIAQAHQQKSA